MKIFAYVNFIRGIGGPFRGSCFLFLANGKRLSSRKSRIIIIINMGFRFTVHLEGVITLLAAYYITRLPSGNSMASYENF